MRKSRSFFISLMMISGFVLKIVDDRFEFLVTTSFSIIYRDVMYAVFAGAKNCCWQIDFIFSSGPR